MSMVRKLQHGNLPINGLSTKLSNIPTTTRNQTVWGTLILSCAATHNCPRKNGMVRARPSCRLPTRIRCATKLEPTDWKIVPENHNLSSLFLKSFPSASGPSPFYSLPNQNASVVGGEWCTTQTAGLSARNGTITRIVVLRSACGDVIYAQSGLCYGRSAAAGPECEGWKGGPERVVICGCAGWLWFGPSPSRPRSWTART